MVKNLPIDQEGCASKDALVGAKVYRRDIQLGSKAVVNDDDDDASYVSVRDRLRKFQSATMIDVRQEGDEEEVNNESGNDAYVNVMGRYREYQQKNNPPTPLRNMGSVSSPCTNSQVGSVTPSSILAQNRLSLTKSTSKARSLASYSPSNSTRDQKSFPPLTVSFRNDIKDSEETDGYKYGNVSLKKVEKPIEERWKQKPSNNTTESDRLSDGRRKSFPAQKSEANTKSSQMLSPSPSSLNSRSYGVTTPTSEICYNRPNAFKNRSSSLPMLSSYEMGKGKEISNVSTRTNESSNRIKALISENERLLKKVGPPVMERWSHSKTSVDHKKQITKPEFTTMKLKSIVDASDEKTSTIAARVAETRQHCTNQEINYRRVLNNRSCYGGDEAEEPTLATRRKRFEVPSRIDTAGQVSRICYGETNVRPYSSDSIDRKSLSSGGNRVSDLAKTFSAKTLSSPNDERSEEKSSGGRPNEIEMIRSSLRSTAKELEGIRNSLSSPVAQMIAERNKAAEANSSRGASGGTHIFQGRPTAYNQFRTSAIKNLQNYDQGRPCDPPKSEEEGNTTMGYSEQVSDVTCLESPKAAENSFPLSPRSEGRNAKDDRSFFDFGKISPISEATCNMHSSFIHASDHMLQSNSSISDYTTDSDGDWPIYRGENRFIQFTLSTGGVTERIEPNINIFTPPRMGSGDSLSTPSLTDVSSKRDKMKGMKKFFFGKSKKRMVEDE